MPNSKEIPDKGLLRSANSGMTELVLFFTVIPHLMRDLILAGGKYQLHMPCLVVRRFLIKASYVGQFRNDGIGVIFHRHPALDAGSHIGWWEIPTSYAMPSSKEIPDKGLLTSANSGMTELVLFFTVIPHMMRDLILAGGKYLLHLPCLVVRRFLIKAS
jgi:hypothetical protein